MMKPKPRKRSIRDVSFHELDQMKALHRGGMTNAEIAERLSVSVSLVKRAVTGEQEDGKFSREFFAKAGERGGRIGGPISRTKMTKERAREIAVNAVMQRSKNPQKLSAKDIPVILKRRDAGEPAHVIAKDFGVKPFTIFAIAYGRIWKKEVQEYRAARAEPKRRAPSKKTKPA